MKQRIAVLFLMILIKETNFAQTLDLGIATTNGIVRSTLQSGNMLYLGGDFTQLGLSRKKIARYSAGNIKPDANFPQLEGNIYDIESDGSGGYYLAGYFYNFNGMDISNNSNNPKSIIHILADYSFDNSFTPTDLGVHAALSVQKQGNRLYICGSFFTVNNVSRPHLAALDPVNGSLLNWTPAIDEKYDYVTSIDANDSLVFATGGFGIYYGGSYYKSLATFRADNGLVVKNFPTVTSSLGNHIKVYNNKLFISNSNSQYGLAAIGVTKLNNTTGNEDANFPVTDGTVNTILPDGSGGYYIGGYFTRVNGISKTCLAHILSNNTVDATFTANINSEVYTLASDGTNLYIGGGYSQVNGINRTNAASVSLATGSLTTWNPAPNATVFTMVHSSGVIYMGGDFTNIKATVRNHVAAVTTANVLTAWDPNCDDKVKQIIPNQNGSSFFICGFFTTVKGNNRPYISKVNSTDGTPASWKPNPVAGVNCIALNGSTIYIGGYFTSVNGISKEYIAALDTASNNPLSFTANADNYVLALTIKDGKLYVGGNFKQLQSVARNYAASIDLINNTVNSWNPSFNGYCLDTSQVICFAIFHPI